MADEPIYLEAAPWVEISPPRADLDVWAWYCECAAYSIADTRPEAEADGLEHGEFCTKGRHRYFHGIS